MRFIIRLTYFFVVAKFLREKILKNVLGIFFTKFLAFVGICGPPWNYIFPEYVFRVKKLSLIRLVEWRFVCIYERLWLADSGGGWGRWQAEDRGPRRGRQGQGDEQSQEEEEDEGKVHRGKVCLSVCLHCSLCDTVVSVCLSLRLPTCLSVCTAVSVSKKIDIMQAIHVQLKARLNRNLLTFCSFDNTVAAVG